MPSRTLSGAVLATGVLVAFVAWTDFASGEDRAADPVAVRRLLKDPSPSARAAAVRRLAGVEDAAALPVLYDALTDPHPYVRRATAGVLGSALDPAMRRRIADQVPRLKAPTARLEACRAFAIWADEGGWTALRRSLDDAAAPVRAEAARWLAEDAAPPTTERLVRALGDVDPLVRAEAVDALAARPDAPDLAPSLRDADPRVRIAALDGISGRAGEPGLRAVVQGLEDASWSVRALAAERARIHRDRRTLAPLVARLTDERPRVADLAHASLVTLTGFPFDLDPGVWSAWLQGDGKTFDPALREPVEKPAFEREPSGRTVEATRFLDLPIRSKHVGFVIDASGSMAEPMTAGPARPAKPPAAAGAPVPDGATRWEVVRKALSDTLGRLQGATANVFCFADEVEQAFPRAVALGAGRRAEIDAWLEKRRPRGKTALYDGIAAALADPSLDTVVVLSDGVPSAGAFFTKTDLLSEVRRLNRWRRARIDVIAVGSDGIAERWRDVLERIAGETGGRCIRR